MAISRTARKALRNARKGRASADSYLGLLRSGAAAYLAGCPMADNPHTGEAAEIWAEGWQDQQQQENRL